MALSSRCFIHLKPFKVVKTYSNIYDTDAELNNIMAYEINIQDSDVLLPQKVLIKGRITIRNSKITSPNFLSILSLSIKELDCDTVTITPEITFEEVLQSVPNIEIIKLQKTNINRFWAEKLLKFSENLKEVYLTTEMHNFEITTLVNLMTVRFIFQHVTSDLLSTTETIVSTFPWMLRFQIYLSEIF